MSAQQNKENKVRYSTDFIVSDFTDFFDGDQKRKRDQSTDRKKIKILKRLKILHCLNIGLLLLFSMNFLSTIWKNNVLVICISY